MSGNSSVNIFSSAPPMKKKIYADDSPVLPEKEEFRVAQSYNVISNGQFSKSHPKQTVDSNNIELGFSQRNNVDLDTRRRNLKSELEV